MSLSFRMRARLFLPLLTLTWLASACVAEPKESITYLTWDQADTATTQLIHVQTPREARVLELRYGPRAAWDPSTPDVFPLRLDSESLDLASLKRRVHAFPLRGLQPDTEYSFKVYLDGSPLPAYAAEPKRFRTLPDGDAPVRFALGGDTYPGGTLERLHRQAARLDPMFALIGGDIAYDDGLKLNSDKWDRWLKTWEKEMVTPDGRLIPVVLAIGNHEVPGGYGASIAKALYWSNYFRQGPSDHPTYFSRRFGSHTALYVLDSGHVASIGGAQTDWLRSELEASHDRRFRFALYHVPMYPSVRKPDEGQSPHARKHWLPLFDAFGLTAGFENHDHALKRTHPLREGRIDAARGVVYLGDGCWGKGARDLKPPLRPYLAHAEGTPHFWMAELQGKTARFRAFDAEGGLRDETVVPASPSLEGSARMTAGAGTAKKERATAR